MIVWSFVSLCIQTGHIISSSGTSEGPRHVLWSTDTTFTGSNDNSMSTINGGSLLSVYNQWKKKKHRRLSEVCGLVNWLIVNKQKVTELCSKRSALKSASVRVLYELDSSHTNLAELNSKLGKLMYHHRLNRSVPSARRGTDLSVVYLCLNSTYGK